MAKNLVLCLDGTGNQYKTVGKTNVLRLYGLLAHTDPAVQVTYYDPGLGTFSVAGAWTPWARWATRVAGLAFGVGLRQQVAEAYTFVLRHYEPGDRIYLFGFSRGAYTVRVLASLIHTIGIVRPTAENMVPYIAELFLKRERLAPDDSAAAYWSRRSDFGEWFGASGAFGTYIEFAGLWDTVNAVGLLRRHTAPYTAKLGPINTVRHAVSIDERRRPYRPQLVDPTHDDLREVWFAGVHSDIGGGYEGDTRLADITLHWMAGHAWAAGVLLDPRRLPDLHPDAAVGQIHRHKLWWLALGQRPRRPHNPLVHPSVVSRIAHDPGYGRQLPADPRVDAPAPELPR